MLGFAVSVAVTAAVMSSGLLVVLTAERVLGRAIPRSAGGGARRKERGYWAVPLTVAAVMGAAGLLAVRALAPCAGCPVDEGVWKIAGMLLSFGIMLSMAAGWVAYAAVWVGYAVAGWYTGRVRR